MKRTSERWLCVVLLALAVTSGNQLKAQVIDFETIPGGTPSDLLQINTQFTTSNGVTFSLEGGGNPFLAEVGSPRTAFGGPPSNSGNDNPAPNQNIGSYFLTDDDEINSTAPQPLIISYSSPVKLVGGVILDIDTNFPVESRIEQWTIEAKDNVGTILDTIVLTWGDPNTGDGIATPWSFHRPSADVSEIRIAYTGNDEPGVGLGFDNLFSFVVPEPTSCTLVLAALCLALRRRRLGHIAI